MVEDEQSLTGGSGDVMGEDLHDTKHGKTTVLDLLGFVLNGLLAFKLLSKGLAAPAEITDSWAWSLLPADELPEANGENNLKPSETGDCADGSNTVGDRGKSGAIKVDISRKATHCLDKVTSHGKHRNTTVLELYCSTAIEDLLVTVGREAWIKYNYASQLLRCQVKI